MNFELRLFFMAFVFGSVFLLIYEALRALRAVFFHVSWVVRLEDLLFWASAGLTASVLVYRFNGGILRSYLLLGTGLGAILTFLTAGTLIRRILIRILQKLLFFMNSLLSRLLFPVKRCRIIKDYFIGIGRFIRRTTIHRTRRDSRSEKVKR